MAKAVKLYTVDSEFLARLTSAEKDQKENHKNNTAVHTALVDARAYYNASVDTSRKVFVRSQAAKFAMSSLASATNKMSANKVDTTTRKVDTLALQREINPARFALKVARQAETLRLANLVAVAKTEAK